MTNKIPLNDYLVSLDSSTIIAKSSNIVSNNVSLATPLNDFVTSILNHSGCFIINNKKYTTIIPSNNSIYFFNGVTDDTYIVIFNFIIDIKQKDNIFIIFYEFDSTACIELS